MDVRLGSYLWEPIALFGLVLRLCGIPGLADMQRDMQYYRCPKYKYQHYSWGFLIINVVEWAQNPILIIKAPIFASGDKRSQVRWTWPYTLHPKDLKPPTLNPKP